MQIVLNNALDPWKTDLCINMCIVYLLRKNIPVPMLYLLQCLQNLCKKSFSEHHVYVAGVAIILGFFKLIMTSIAALTVDSVGRKPLLLIGVGGIVGSLLILGIAQGILAGGTAGWIVFANVAALLLYVGCYQVCLSCELPFYLLPYFYLRDCGFVFKAV